MATLFWVGGSTAYDGTTNRLATTSGGAASVALITSADTVTFDGNSPAGAVVTTSAAISCSTLTLNTGFTGSLTMSNSLTVAGVITLTQGTLDFNGQTISATSISSSNTNTRTLSMGASAITLTLAGECISWPVVTNFTLNAGTSTITCSGASASMRTSGSTLYNVVFTGGGTTNVNSGGAAMTYNNLTFTGTAAKTGIVQFSSNGQTINGALSIAGNSVANRILAASSSRGTARSITLGASATFRTAGTQHVDFMDITVTGGAANERDLSAITGGAGDANGNTGITFTTPVTRYWVGGTGNWSDTTHWSASSGGASGATVPLPQDSAIVNASSGGGTITVDNPRIASFDMSAAAACTLGASGIAHSLFGHYIMGTNVTISADNRNKTFSGRSSYNITSAGKTFSTGNFLVDAPGGTYTLTDTFTATGATPDGSFTITSGTFNTGNFNMAVGRFSRSGTNTAVCTLGTSIITLSHNAVASVWSFSTLTGLTLNASTATIAFATATSVRTFAGGGSTYGTLDYSVAGSTGGLDITGANTFGTINFSDASNTRTLRFTAATTTTVTNWNVNGTSGKLMVISSITAATHTLAKSSGTVSSDYLNLTNSLAGGGAAWYAGANSTDSGGNTGWIFAAPPSSNHNLALMGIGL